VKYDFLLVFRSDPGWLSEVADDIVHRAHDLVQFVGSYDAVAVDVVQLERPLQLDRSVQPLWHGLRLTAGTSTRVSRAACRAAVATDPSRTPVPTAKQVATVMTALGRTAAPRCSVLFFSRPRSESWPHHRRTYYFLHSSLSSVILTDSSTESPVRVLMLSIQAVNRTQRTRD